MDDSKDTTDSGVLQSAEDSSSADGFFSVNDQRREFHDLSIESTEDNQHAPRYVEDLLIARLEMENDSKTHKINKLEVTVSDLEKARQKSISVIQKLLIKTCDLEQKALMETTEQNKSLLGDFKMERHGTRYESKWINGVSFRHIFERRDELDAKRIQLEQLLRRPVSNRRRLSQPAPSSPFHQSVQGSAELQDMYKLNLFQIKKKQAEQVQELEVLERNRSRHAMELKRLQYQDSSRFNNHPVFNSRYVLLNLLGKGGFSEVYKCFDLNERKYAACKIHQLNSDWSVERKLSYLKHTQRESKIQKQLSHPHVVQLYDMFDVDEDVFCTVLELCSGSDLEFYLKLYKALNEKEVKPIMSQIMKALRYLNELETPVIHYDLKPGNILICDESGRVMITDFGLSKIMDEQHHEMELTSQGAGTYWYLPPECFMVSTNPPKVSSKVDVWSVGVIFYQCLYGERPFGHHLGQHDILREGTILRATSVDFPAKPSVSTEAKDFIRKCLTYDQLHRPDVLALTQHDYFNQSDSKTKGRGKTPQLEHGIDRLHIAQS